MVEEIARANASFVFQISNAVSQPWMFNMQETSCEGIELKRPTKSRINADVSCFSVMNFVQSVDRVESEIVLVGVPMTIQEGGSS